MQSGRPQGTRREGILDSRGSAGIWLISALGKTRDRLQPHGHPSGQHTPHLVRKVADSPVRTLTYADADQTPRARSLNLQVLVTVTPPQYLHMVGAVICFVRVAMQTQRVPDEQSKSSVACCTGADQCRSQLFRILATMALDAARPRPEGEEKQRSCQWNAPAARQCIEVDIFVRV